MLTPEEQLHIIKSGTAQIVPESALLEKLKRCLLYTSDAADEL